jgi:hypothetical protein
MSRYYDYVLGLIPTALIGVTVFLSAVGVPWHTAVPAGAAVAIGVMAHAMFVRAPQPASSTAVADAAASASDVVGSDVIGAGSAQPESVRSTSTRPGPGSGSGSNTVRANSSSEHAGSGPNRYGSGTDSVAGGD